MNLPNSDKGNIEEQINSTLANMAAIRNSSATNSTQYLDLIHLFIDNVFDCIKNGILREIGGEVEFNEQLFIIFYRKMVEFGTVALIRGAMDYESLSIFFGDFMENLDFLYPRDINPKPWLKFESTLAEQIGIIKEVCSDTDLIRFHADALINKPRTLFEN